MNTGDDVVVLNCGSSERLQRVVRVSATGAVITLDDGTRWREGGARKQGEDNYRLRIKLPDEQDRVNAYKRMIEKAANEIHAWSDRAVDRLRAALDALGE